MQLLMNELSPSARITLESTSDHCTVQRNHQLGQLPACMTAKHVTTNSSIIHLGHTNIHRKNAWKPPSIIQHVYVIDFNWPPLPLSRPRYSIITYAIEAPSVVDLLALLNKSFLICSEAALQLQLALRSMFYFLLRANTCHHSNPCLFNRFRHQPCG